MSAFETISGFAGRFADHLSETFSVARLLYSVVLILIIFLLVKELATTWRIGKISVAEFVYYADGAKKPEFGEQLRAETIEFYYVIIDLIRREWQTAKEEQKEEEEDKTGANSEQPATSLPPISNELLAELKTRSSELQQLEITVQGVSIKNLLSSLSGLVAPQARELSAVIVGNSNDRRVFVTSPHIRDHATRTDESPVPVLIGKGAATDTDTAFRIACYMIWSQWDAAAEDIGVGFDEFCNFARLLYIRHAFTSLQRYEFKKENFASEIKFLVDLFPNAVLGRPQYTLIYSSLVGLEEYVGDEKIRLNDQTTATINSVADIVFLLSLNDAGGNDRSGAWTKTLPASVSQREVINEAYFHDRILLDCKPDGTLNDFAGKVPKQVVEQLQNVVRITFQSGDQVVVRSGLIVADESVITVGRLDRWERKWDSFPGGQVQLVKCGKLIQSHAVTAVERLNDSPLFKLTVPGLKLPSSSPRLALDATSNDATPDEAHLLGYVRRSDQLFAASSPTSPPGIDNDNQWIMSGSIQTGRRPSVIGEQWREDHTIRFATDMPYAAGLVGSPILADNGAVLGFVDRGSANSGHLRRSLGVSAAPLATVLASGDTSKPKKTSPRRGPVSTR